MKATKEMIAAGAEAARKHMEETGGNSPAVIWDAMWVAHSKETEQPPTKEPHAHDAVTWTPETGYVFGQPKEPKQEPVPWDEAQRICNLPAVDEAIRALIEDSHNDNAVCMVQAILTATTPSQRKPLTEWQPIDTAPKDKQLLLAAEFFRPNDWRIKAGYYSSELKEWHVWGASWIPTRWMHLPESPSIEAAHGINRDIINLSKSSKREFYE